MTALNQNRISILSIIDSLGQGGAEQMLVNLLPALAKNNFDTEVVCLFTPEPLAPVIEKMGIKVHALNLSHRWNFIECAFKLWPILKSKKYSIIHGHLFFGILYAVLAQKLQPQAKVVASLHSLEFERDLPTSPWHRLRLALRKRLLKQGVDFGVAVSAATLNHYRENLGELHWEVIPNSIPEELFSQIKPPNDDPKVIRIAVPARLIKEKGHTVLLSALAKIKNQLSKDGRKTEVSFLGGGPMAPVLNQKIKELGLEEIVFVKGLIPHSCLISELLNSDLVILPSLSEGFGVAAIEAMALGTLVIASKTGGLAQIIDDSVTGILVEPGNVDSLAEAITEYLNHQFPVGAMVSRAKLIARERYAMTAVIKEWRAFYEKILREESP